VSRPPARTTVEPHSPSRGAREPPSVESYDLFIETVGAFVAAMRAGDRCIRELDVALEPEQLLDAIGPMLELGRIRVQGLMTMAPLTAEERVLRRAFTTARDCLARCQAELPGFDGRTLSMGMSNDFEIAVEEGSTEVRLGTVLLGERPEGRWS